MNRKNKKGFTLVELMVVAIIVAILAAVAIPLMTANKKRAAASEGEAGLGSLRTCMRSLKAQTDAYNKALDGTTINVGDLWTKVPGASQSDLNGRYFDGAAYDLTTVSASNYTLRVRGSQSTVAPDLGIVAGVVMTLDQDGQFSRTGL